MDSILSVFTERARIAVASEEEMPLCELIAFDGYIEILSHNSRKIRLTDDGKKFISQGGYKSRFWKFVLKLTVLILSVISAFSFLVSCLMSH